MLASPASARLPPGDVELEFVHIGSDDESVRRQSCQRDSHVAAATSHVEAARRRMDPHPLEQRTRGRPRHPGEHPQAFSARQSTTNHIVVSAHTATPCARTAN